MRSLVGLSLRVTRSGAEVVFVWLGLLVVQLVEHPPEVMLLDH
jgi:hypothetical protein